LETAVAGDDGPSPARLTYNRDVRPILSDACFSCHGPDAKARKGGLRLDVKDEAYRDRDGAIGIVPGDPDGSDAITRIEEEDESLRMPPRDSGKHLTPDQIAILRRWVAEGAEYQPHWAFVTPEKVEPPTVPDPAWSRTAVDRFLRSKLDAAHLTPAAEADRVTLIRRVTLDLTGLPPTPAEVDTFLADTAPDSYDRLVDRLLASPRFGEHMARYWLDAARYGDTHGLHLDNYREMWPYRDWVIRAFNQNLPFDQFIVQQLAGDMLPDATLDQQVASGFNRAHVTTSEGGSIAEEVYVRNVTDRVDTVGTVMLGLTTGCAKCHDHKYDPFTRKEYYSLFAYFNSLDEDPLDGNIARHAPIVMVPSAEQQAQRAKLDAEIAAGRQKIAEAVQSIAYDDAPDAAESEIVKRGDFVWIDDALPEGAQTGNPNNGPWPFVGGPDHVVARGQSALHIASAPDTLTQEHFNQASRPLVVGSGDVLFASVFLDPADPPKEVMFQFHVGGWSHRAYWGENKIDWGKDGTPERMRLGDLPPTGTWVRLEVPVASLGLKPGTKIDGWAFTQFGGNVYYDAAGAWTVTPQPGQIYDRLTPWVRDQKLAGGEGLPDAIKAIVKAPRDKRTDEQKQALRSYFLGYVHAPSRAMLEPLTSELTKREAERKAVEDAIPATLVSRERKEPKEAFDLDRGEYDRRSDPVGRVLPAFLPPLPQGASADRLGLARWLVMPEHPLTARVAVNRFWQQVFGAGLVKTSEDFGLQGEPPSHPELLDWLAVDFREHGWDVKRLLGELVRTEAYKQSGLTTPEKLQADPANRLLSRGPRFRLDAESLRDQALFVSGLLEPAIGGPSVKPPQPAGLWEAVGYTSSNTAKFVADTGPQKVHRRSLYTFWKRTSPPPQMTTFDAPSRESCIVRRERTNTPLQALLLMNEPQYVEASRGLASRALLEGPSSEEERIDFLFRLATSRRPEPAERQELAAALTDFRTHYKANAEAAKSLISQGETPPNPALDATELAAWTMVGNLVLNLDEVVTN
jgi:hypothetical protein